MCDYCNESIQSHIFGQWTPLKNCENPCLSYRQFVREAYIARYGGVRREAHGAVLRKHPDDPALAQAGEGLLAYRGLTLSDQREYCQIFNENNRRLRNPKFRYLYNATASRSSRRVGARRSLRKPSVGGERLSEGESEQLRINEFMRK